MILLTVLVVALLAFHAFIHWGLRPGRMAEKNTPASLGLEFLAVRIPGPRGRALFAWYLPPVGAGPAPAALVLHGWGGNMETMLPLAAPLHGAGYGLLFLDARCHGGSDGDTFASMPRFAEDMESGLAWLLSRTEVDQDKIVLVGHSVGAAAALLLASRRRDIGAVVSIAAFSHPARVMGIMLDAWHIPLFPIGWYVLRYVEWLIGHSFDAIAPLHTITRVACPVLLVHGAEDQTVPLSDARALQAARGGLPGRLLEVAGSHDSYEELDQRLPEVIRFLDEALDGGAGFSRPALN